MTDRKMQLEDWLDDLCVRFIINLPAADLEDVARICFQVEEAQWYYEDFIRPLDPTLPSLSLRNFCLRIFAHCPLLAQFARGREMQAFEEFLTYKKRIPVRGAIMLNEAMDSAVLVKGWKKGANWSFPRGKINLNEDDLICAIREVYEETGLDLEAAGLVPSDRQVKYIEVNMREQQMKLFVFRDVPMDTYFEPRTRKEISKIQWWHLSELPAFRKKNQTDQVEATGSANKFYMVAPFLVPLRKWIVEQKKRDISRKTSTQYQYGGISHDDFMTEEDRGEEQTTQPLPHIHNSPPESSTFEEANATLSRLLKIEPPTQGLQLDALKPIHAPTTKDSGHALLAFLQSKPLDPGPPVESSALHGTPVDHSIGHSPLPRNLHDETSNPLRFSSMQPPPSVPKSFRDDSVSYQQSSQKFQDQSSTNIVSHGQSTQVPARLLMNPHPYQSQHLIHPQPLPPHVQTSVFTGGPVHAPVVPQSIYHSQVLHMNYNNSRNVSTPQFPGLHAPTSPSFPSKTTPKLTSHSLALLNAFKSRDQADSEGVSSNDDTLARYKETGSRSIPPQPQELPAGSTPLDLDSFPPRQIASQFENAGRMNTTTLPPRPPISESQRSTLLGLFRSPVSQAAIAAGLPASTALPTSTTPSAVELSAVEPLSNTLSAFSVTNTLPVGVSENSTNLKAKPEASPPFRAMSILARPSETSEKEVASNSATSQHGVLAKKGKHSTSKSSVREQITKTHEKPFQPQILKRPQPGDSNAPETACAVEPIFSVPALQPAVNRHTGQSTDHKDTLLSLFGKAPSAVSQVAKPTLHDAVPSTHFADQSTTTAVRSRVGSLTSGEAASRRGSQTPISQADRGFLLGYLDAVIK